MKTYEFEGIPEDTTLGNTEFKGTTSYCQLKRDMTFKKAQKHYRNICLQYFNSNDGACAAECPLQIGATYPADCRWGEGSESIEQILTDWAKAHPTKTNRQVLEEFKTCEEVYEYLSKHGVVWSKGKFYTWIDEEVQDE